MAWARWSSRLQWAKPYRRKRDPVQKCLQLITLGADHPHGAGNPVLMPPSVGALHSSSARFDPRLSRFGLRHFVPRLPFRVPSAGAAGSPGESGLRLAPNGATLRPYGLGPTEGGGRRRNRVWLLHGRGKPRLVEGARAGARRRRPAYRGRLNHPKEIPTRLRRRHGCGSQ